MTLAFCKNVSIYTTAITQNKACLCLTKLTGEQYLPLSYTSKIMT